MKSTRSDRLIGLGLEIYFIFIFFYGVIIKFTFPYPMLFSLKTYVPELVLAFVCMVCLTKKNRISKNAFVMLVIFITVFSLNFLTSFSVNSFMMTFRDVLIPIIVGFLLSSVKITEESVVRFGRNMVVVCYIALLFGAVLGVVQYMRGWRWTSAWYTGYSFWGEDARSSMYIMSTASHVRVPSIVGHNVKFAMYSFFQFLFIVCFNNYRKSEYSRIGTIVAMILMLINVYISNNKTTLVIVFIIFVIYLMKKFQSKTRIIACMLFLVLGSYIYYELSSSTNFLISFYDRFSKWSILKEPEMLRNIVLPISTFNFAGNSTTSIPVLNYWDNTYFYFLFSFGLVAVLALFLWLKKIYTDIQKSSKNGRIKQFVLYLTIFASIAALTTSIVLGRCFFNIYLIAISYYFALEEKNDI